MSIIVSSNKVVVHSTFPPVLFDSNVEPGKRYVIAEGEWVEVSPNITYADIIHFRKVLGEKHHAFESRFEQEVAGSKGKTYTVTCESNIWSCTCPAFSWSGNSRTCKHITQIKKENGW
jgi:hypothetical protein